MTVAATGWGEQWALPPSYVRAVQAAGGTPVPIPVLGADDEALWALYERLDGLLLCGGGDVAPDAYGATNGGHCTHVLPERDALELVLTRRALAEGLPVLGICRGIQILNVAAGGTLVQDIASTWPDPLNHSASFGLGRDCCVHTVSPAPDSLLSRLGIGAFSGKGALGEVWVNSMHHQAIDRLGHGLRVTGRSEDGLIEAVEGMGASGLVVGVQWHPEELLDGNDGLHRALFINLVRHAQGAQEE
jgi:putative glutamine amidotransferase